MSLVRGSFCQTVCAACLALLLLEARSPAVILAAEPAEPWSRWRGAAGAGQGGEALFPATWTDKGLNSADGQEVVLVWSGGRDLGPDLLTVVGHPPEKLLGSILDPSADIQPGFNAYTCTLNTGEQIYGLLASESATGVVMKLVDGTIRNVLRTQIATLQSPDVSLMPEGLEGAIDRQGMADLIAFLRQPLTGAGR